MTLKAAPLIDSRSRDKIAEQTRVLLCHYLAGAPYNWTENAVGGEAGKALTHIFARYCELIIDGINRAPEKNFLAFLDLLGNSPVPPLPARAPLTFALDARAAEGVTVPAGTRVQAEPGAGGGEPILFETERDLFLTTLELKALEKVSGDGATHNDLATLIWNPLDKGERSEGNEKLSQQNSMYRFGFHLAEGKTFPVDHSVSMFFFIDSPLYDPSVPAPSSSSGLRTVWEYSSGTDDWKELYVEDKTDGLTQSGAVEFLVPQDFAQKQIDQSTLFWVQVHLESPGNDPAPRLKSVAINTVYAEQAISLTNEILGSSNGNADQTFTTFRKPILPGEQLAIMEGLQYPKEGGGQPQEHWVTWQEVADFYGSTPQDRHYVPNRQTGEVHFGNGQNGRIPPPDTRNVRMTYYRTGGGSVGNVPAGAIKTLVSGSKSIEQVINFLPAAGGAESESAEALLNRAPKTLRHRRRAVTEEDYVDLAKLASTEVARALCVPLMDLAHEPCKRIRTLDDSLKGAGWVSVIIVPDSRDPKPLPSQTLLRHVKDTLCKQAIATALIAVVGPLYLRVDVAATLHLESLQFADSVKRDFQAKLAAYLHPLTGRDGTGWPFGRRPQDSDIYRLIRTIPGVRYVSALTIALVADQQALPGCEGNPKQCIEDTGRFLIYSGTHTVSVETP